MFSYLVIFLIFCTLVGVFVKILMETWSDDAMLTFLVAMTFFNSAMLSINFGNYITENVFNLEINVKNTVENKME